MEAPERAKRASAELYLAKTAPGYIISPIGHSVFRTHKLIASARKIQRSETTIDDIEGTSGITRASAAHGLDNQDAIDAMNFFDGRLLIRVVADGMGGHPPCPAMASRRAVNTVRAVANAHFQSVVSLLTEAGILFMIRDAFSSAHAAVRAIHSRIGTTLTVAAIWKRGDGTHRILIGQAGDSPVYVAVDHNRLFRLTIDNIGSRMIFRLLSNQERALLERPIAGENLILFDWDHPPKIESIDRWNQTLWEIERAHTFSILNDEELEVKMKHRSGLANNLGYERSDEPMVPIFFGWTVPSGFCFRVISASDGLQCLTYDEINQLVLASPTAEGTRHALLAAVEERANLPEEARQNLRPLLAAARQTLTESGFSPEGLAVEALEWIEGSKNLHAIRLAVSLSRLAGQIQQKVHPKGRDEIWHFREALREILHYSQIARSDADDVSIIVTRC